MHTVLCLGTNDNVRVFRLLCILLGICKIGLSSNIVVVAFITHRIVTTDGILKKPIDLTSIIAEASGSSNMLT